MHEPALPRKPACYPPALGIGSIKTLKTLKPKTSTTLPPASDPTPLAPPVPFPVFSYSPACFRLFMLA